LDPIVLVKHSLTTKKFKLSGNAYTIRKWMQINMRDGQYLFLFMMNLNIPDLHLNKHKYYWIQTNCQKLGDEYHYVLECSSLNDKRKQLLPKYFMKRHNVVKFFELLSTKKQSLFRKLCIFIKHINKVFCTPYVFLTTLS
jgi:hypothetical protein